MLKLENIHAGYGPIDVLKGIMLEVEEGEIVTVLGANGAGKSTTLMTISGVNHCRQGRITFSGNPIQNLPAHEIVRLGISQVPEGRRIFPRLTVRENLEMGGWLIRNEHEKQETLNEMYHLFPRLEERKRQKAGSLSGGERQMLAVARALMIKPKLLMMDEPSLGLMPKLVDAIFEKIVEIKKRGVAILLVEQNNKALDYVDRGYIMDIGSITFGGSAMDLRSQIVF